MTSLFTKNKVRVRSQKEKSTRTQMLGQISNPATTILRSGPGEGLYLKLMGHQKSIATQIKFITSALEGNGHASYRSRHNKMDLTSVVTALLVQVDCAVTTAHQCLSKEDDSIKPHLQEFENRIYRDTAFLVRWIDFDSKGIGREMPPDKSRIAETIKSFEESLAEVVRLVYQCHLESGTASTPGNRMRRLTDAGILSPPIKLNTSGFVGLADSPISEQRSHPMVDHARTLDMRKGSWAPANSNLPAGTNYRGKANTLSPALHSSRDSGLSEGSSGGVSDEERRRSGNSDHYMSGGQSPEHSTYGRESMSPDWDSSRASTMTTPNDSSLHRHGGPSGGPIPIAAPLAPEMMSLPPLPGELYDTPPPLPHREDEETRGEPRPPLPVKKGSSLPRDMDMNGYMSAEANIDHTDGGVAGGGAKGGAQEEEELPPPIPVKKRHASVAHTNQPNGITSHLQSDEDVPPPVPLKMRRNTPVGSAGGQRGSISSPLGTPTHHPPTQRHPSLPLGLGEGTEYGGTQGGGGPLSLPPVPLRMESIPGVKTVLGQDTPPPKPPRNDRPASTEMLSAPRPSLVPVSQEMEALNAVKKYNEEIRKAKESGPDVAPPVPLKKKTIIIYKGLLEGYNFDESLMQPLYIPGMEAPPPLPPKKRRRQRRHGATANRAMPPVDPSRPMGLDTLRRVEEAKRNSISDDIDELEEGTDIEVNYLECEDASGYLVFNKEESGGYTLKGGPVDALIAYAASSAKSVKHFSEAFLLTYYTFITPGELITKLLYRLTYFYRSSVLAVWQATTSLLVRVLTGLKQVLSKESQVDLIDLVHKMITDGNLKFAQLLRNVLVEKLNQLIIESNSSIPLGNAFTTNTLSKKTVMDFSPENIARQMTILDNELFQKVDVCEMLYWAKEQNEEKSPMLTQFTLHFNNVSQWTKVTLLKRGVEMKVRCKIMMHFIAIMKSLLDSFNNFNSYLAILSAIESSPISRLDWPDKILKGLEEPRQLIDNRGSFKNYREAFAQAKPPCIPYIGLYLQDLTFIEMQPSKLEEDPTAINFTKRWKQFKSVDHIRFAQTKQYTFIPDPELLSLFKNFVVKETDEELWSISTEIKPSQRSQRTHQN